MGNPVAPFKNVLVIVARDDENFITTLTIFMYINWIVIMHHLVITYVIWRALLQFFFKFYKKKSLNESLSDKVKYVKRSQKATLKNSRETNSYFSIHPSILPIQGCRSADERWGTPWIVSVTGLTQRGRQPFTHILTLKANLGTPINLIPLMCMSLDRGRKSKYLERTHTDSGRTFKYTTKKGPAILVKYQSGKGYKAIRKAVGSGTHQDKSTSEWLKKQNEGFAAAKSKTNNWIKTNL